VSLGIRHMRAGEEEAVAVLLRRMPADIGLDVVPKVTGESLREAQDLAHVTIAEDAGLILGVCLWCMTFSSWRGAKGIYISDLYVLEHARGRKVGEKLLRGVMADAAKQGACFIKMEVDSTNTGAHRFYGRLGFVHKSDDQFHVLEPDGYAAMLKGVTS
jgi:ribosomal protein S18 acetylase RimI-like enzyme